MTTWDSLPWAKQIEELFRWHAPGVYRFALRGLGDVEQAKDVVQQVFLAVCNQYERHFLAESDDHQAALIMTMARRRVIDCWRQASRAKETLYGDLGALDRPQPELLEMSHRITRSDRIMEDAELRRFWEVLTRDLTESEYRVALMSWDMEMSTEDIARVLNTTSHAVVTHRSRARRKIGKVLSRRSEWDEGGAGA
ncbi:sigma-70 family RNA polymerase sigma factor [Nocardia uniformis]|uniref:Sigma-70 family RNA polymerase sigma factor n=1 Tax=Nocardia uniformis TaxID=53432 RepID=A0A849CD16_9NOCA|nr:sigma-70 family RNA polymerase sigma factor [Nocardia uniformis]NNH72979.1 sigma-70 family RNA polymerase sigma factor [Nocardia uniformis]